MYEDSLKNTGSHPDIRESGEEIIEFQQNSASVLADLSSNSLHAS